VRDGHTGQRSRIARRNNRIRGVSGSTRTVSINRDVGVERTIVGVNPAKKMICQFA